jgi:uncharacterized protein YjiS (DUF1127 family)
LGEIEDALDDIGITLKNAFEETMNRIQDMPEGRRRLGMHALAWISYARRPLTVCELLDVLDT